MRTRSEATGSGSAVPTTRKPVNGSQTESGSAPVLEQVADGSDEGKPVEATWGEELFQPMQYNTFRVGPFRAATVVRPGERVADALVRLYGEIDAVAQKLRRQKVDGYLRALREIGESAERGGR